MEPRHSVLIPVANPDTAAQFVHLGARIAEKEGSTLLLLHVATDASPATSDETSESNDVPILERARRFAADYNVPVETAARAAPTVADGIIRESQAAHVDYLIMGWRADVPDGTSMIGSHIDQVVKESGCHTIVMQQGVDSEGAQLLVPVANPHAAPLALAVAALLPAGDQAEITVLHLSPLELSGRQRAAFRSTLFAAVGEGDRGPQSLFRGPTRFELVFEVQDDPARELGAWSEHYDRMILGTSRGGYSGGPVFERLQLEIAERSQCPVIFVRPKEKGARFNY